jgi:hypothetical protein
LVPFFTFLFTTAGAQDLWITPEDQDHIRINVIADSQCPIACGDVTLDCCANFAANVEHMNTRVPDLTMMNGDLVIDCHDSLAVSEFLQHWGDLVGEKHFILGNHEADPNENFYWEDPNDHWVPAVAHEPLFQYGTPDYRRWYSIYVGNPPRIAVFGLNNNSDSYVDDDVCYLFCATPVDSLNHAGSAQRAWLNAQIDALPSTVEVVLICLHRSYYGVENYLCRPNIQYSWAEFLEAPAETLRTGEVSFLRDLESIPDRTNVQRVIVASGDQHCFAITHPIRRNVRDDEQGIPYIVLGGGGARIKRSAVYPALDKIPSGLLVSAFDDKWFNTTFQFSPEEIQFTVHEAYSDSVLFETSWPLVSNTGAGDGFSRIEQEARMEISPNPVRGNSVRLEIRFPGSGFLNVDRLTIADITGRRVRRLARQVQMENGGSRTWDLLDDRGQRVRPGVYLAVLRSGSKIFTEKITVLR